MINGELFKMRDAAKEKVDFLNVPEEFVVDQIFNGLSFESDHISRDEVVKCLNGEKIDENKALLITNHKNAFMLAVKMVKEQIPMNENNLKDLHQTLMEGISNIGGLYRNVDISINGSNHTPPNHLKVYDKMKKYFDYVHEGPKDNILEYIAYCHLQLAKIHPFLDGNGRLARIVLNYHLLSNNLMPVFVKFEERKRYFSLLEEFKVNKKTQPFIDFLVELETRSLKKVL